MSFRELVDLDQAQLRCPARSYVELRELGVHYSEVVDAYVVAQHDDVVSVLRNHKVFSSAITVGNPVPPPDAPPPSEANLRPLLILSDDPEHARRRSIVNRAFTPSRVASWEPIVRDLVAERIRALRDQDDVDLVRDLARPLPIRVITMVLGVPDEDVERFRVWSEAITSGVGGKHGPNPELDAIRVEFAGYISQLLDERKAEPRDDVLSSIAASELERHQCISFVMELLIAGNITTTHHLANSMLLIARTPGLFDQLRDDRDLIPRFVEESLRLESPIQGFYRLATEDTVVGGVDIPAGSRLFVLYQSANLDPDAWGEECPHLRLDRPNASAHIAFGKGPHACLGSSLARLEGRLVVEELVASLDGYELLVGVDEVPYGASFINHGVTSLPVRIDFATAAAG